MVLKFATHNLTYHDFDEMEVLIFATISNALDDFSDVRRTVNDRNIDRSSSHWNGRFTNTSSTIQ